ncbi:MAG: MFS transporter, partial [Stackebrandtia sp.]
MSADSLTATQIRRRYFVMLGLRWMPVGILIPSLVLLAADRDISVGDIGMALSLRGFIWLFMDLPAGSLADTWGRRSVLLSGGVVNLGSLLILATVPTFTGLMLFSVLQGIYRGLDNGALTSWFVDATQALPGNESIDRGLRIGGAILGYAIAAGCLVCGALILTEPFPNVEPLNGPVIVGGFL